MTENLNLYQKLAKVRRIADAVSKNKKGYGYTYADITEILAKVTAGMDKYGVSLIPQIVPGTFAITKNVMVNTKTDKTGKSYEHTSTEMLVTADMIYKWVNDDNPDEYIEVPWAITGSQNDPSQAFGSGMTYCSRYFLTNYFQIGQTDNDVDGYRSKQKAAADAEDKAIADEIISKFDVIVKQFLFDNNDKTEEVKKFISKYAKGGNYFAIHDPKLAGSLLEDFSKKYIKEN